MARISAPLFMTLAGPALMAACAQTAFAQGTPPTLSLNESNIDAMCKAVVNDKTETLEACRQEEGASFAFVTSWLQSSDLLDEDGAIDMFKLANAQSDPLSAVNTDPGVTASFCLQNATDWITLGDCINALDQNATYRALGLGDDRDMDDSLLTPDDGLN